MLKGTKGKNRGMAHRRHTHDTHHAGGWTRRSRGEDRHDFYGDPPKRVLERMALREVAIDFTEVTEPVIAKPFFETEGIGNVTIGGPAPTKVASASTRRQPKRFPWEGGDKPWHGRSRSFVFA